MGNIECKHANLFEEAFFVIVNGEIFAWEAFEAELQRQGVPITVGRFIPLHYLVSSPMHLQDLTERTCAKPSAMSRLIERMVRDGLVEKQRDESDGRAVLLCATDEGRRVESKGFEVFERCTRELFADLNETEIHTLCKLIGRMREPVEEVGL